MIEVSSFITAVLIPPLRSRLVLGPFYLIAYRRPSVLVPSATSTHNFPRDAIFLPVHSGNE